MTMLLTGAGKAVPGSGFLPSSITGLYQWLYDGATTPVEQTSAITGSPMTVVNSRAGTGDRRELRQGRVAQGDGAADYITFGNVLDYDGSSSGWSVAFDWAGTGTNQYICGKQSSAVGWYVYIDGTGKVQFGIINTYPSNHLDQRSASAYNDGTMRKFVITYDGSQSASGVTMYVNGSAISLAAPTADTLSATATNAGPFEIARSNGGGLNNGAIHSVAVWSKELSAVEVTAITDANDYTTPGSVELLAWLSEEVGSVCLDSSGNGRHGTYTGTLADIHQPDTGVTYSAANELGYTVADGSTMYAEVGLSTLLTAGTIIPRDESNPTKCCAYDSGGQLDLQYTGQAPYYGRVIQSGALQGDGAADHATVPQAVLDAIEGSATATLVMWGDRQSAGNDLFFGIGDGTTNNRIVIAPFNDGEVYAIVGNGSNSYGQVTDNNTGPICWVLVFDGGQTGNANRLKLYKNGGSVTLSFTGTIPATLPATLSVGRIGRHTASAIYADGIQWCHAVYSDALSAAEVLALYESGTYPTDNLEALYPCSEMNTAETTVYDVSGNERHATISGTTADVRAGRQDAIAWNQLHGFSKSGSTYIPGFNGLKPDGVTATDSAPGATADVFHLDGSQLDRSGGVTTPLARNVNAIDTSYEVGDGQINPEFVRETATTADRLLAYEAALTGDDLTNANDYTT